MFTQLSAIRGSLHSSVKILDRENSPAPVVGKQLSRCGIKKVSLMGSLIATSSVRPAENKYRRSEQYPVRLEISLYSMGHFVES